MIRKILFYLALFCFFYASSQITNCSFLLHDASALYSLSPHERALYLDNLPTDCEPTNLQFLERRLKYNEHPNSWYVYFAESGPPHWISGVGWTKVYRGTYTKYYKDSDNDGFPDDKNDYIYFTNGTYDNTGISQPMGAPLVCVTTYHNDDIYLSSTHHDYTILNSNGTTTNFTSNENVYFYNGFHWVSDFYGFDCDPDNPNTPAAIERIYPDFDADGYGNIEGFPLYSQNNIIFSVKYKYKPVDCSYTYPYNFPYSTNNEDCNDIEPSVTIQPINWYLDSDNDGYGTPFSFINDCKRPDGYVDNADDCNDSNPKYNIVSITWYADFDDDGFGDPNDSVVAFCPPENYITDCYFDDCPTEAGTRTNGCPISSYDFDNDNQNYIYERTYLNEFSLENIENANNEDVSQHINYFDGTGRKLQERYIANSPTGMDIVQFYDYDGNGQMSKSYLPYVSSNGSGTFENDASDKVLAYYNTEDYEYTTNPYSEIITENSPLDKVSKQGAPGKDWEVSTTDDTDHTIKYNYKTNDTDYIKKFDVIHPDNSIEETELIYNGYYNANTLTKLIVKNENWKPNQQYLKNNTTETYTNVHGHTILRRTYNDGIAHDTYYVHDSFGNLTYVIPPEASDHIINEGGQGFIANTTNYPWTDLMQVSKSFAEEYEALLKDYDNEALLNADLDNAYGGQGGFTVSTTTSGDLMFSINIASTKSLDIKTGAIVTLKPFGDFKDTELGRTNDGNYIFSIKNNSIWIDYSKRDFKAPTDITALNYTFSNGTKLEYNENYSWAEITVIDTATKTQYINALKEANVDNADILDTNIPNSYNGQGGLNVSIDANDVITLSVNINTTTPLRLKQGILFPLNTKRRFPNKTIGNIGDYTFSIKDNSIYVEGAANFTSLSGTRYASSDTPSYSTDTATLEGLCYIYHYDYKNRLIEKKISGKDWEYMVYDMQDRIIGTQDGNLRINNDWLFTKYDAFGRVTYTGLQKNTSWTRTSLQTSVNNNNTFNTNNNNSFRDQTGFIMNGITVYYTKHTSWPMGFSEVLTVNYYDDYNVNISSELHYQDSYDQTQIASTRNLSTVSKVRILESNSNYGNHWMTSVSYYDDKARPTFVVTKNSYLNTIDWAKTQFNFASEIIETTRYHQKVGHQAIETINSFTYDHAGRLLTQTQTINNSTPELIVNNHYNELGQLVTKNVGGDVDVLPEQSNGLQSIDYSYNIRGWLKQINDVDQLGNDLFGFKINYNTTEIDNSKALYNGNISETHWATANDHIKRNYYYKYDALNRINEAIYSNTYQGNDPLTTNESFNLLGVNYDKNGNIISLQRTGRYYQTPQYSGLEHHDTIDNLSYSYEPLSNKLLNVNDTASNNFGFKDGNTGAEDYQYDINGNMIVDANKGITNITYNYLNLPLEITTSNGSISYIYNAVGVKLEKVITEGSSVTSTKYAGGYIYSTDTTGEHLKFFSHPEGYVDVDGTRYKYIYQYKDHLGNIRLSYTRNGNSLEIVEEDNYYPFGLKHKGYNNIITPSSNDVANKFKYNNTELEDALGVNLYEMPWRQYDPSIARWTGIDPITHHSMSTYTAFDNNPILWADPSGADSEGYFGEYDLEWGGYMSRPGDPDYSDEGQVYGHFMFGGGSTHLDEALVIAPKRPDSSLFSAYLDMDYEYDFEFESNSRIRINKNSLTATKFINSLITIGAEEYLDHINYTQLSQVPKGYFSTIFKDKTVVWSNWFRGNGSVSGALVKEAKLDFSKNLSIGKGLSNLKMGTSSFGYGLTGLSIYLDTQAYVDGEIGGGKYSWRMGSTGLSASVGYFLGAGPGLMIGSFALAVEKGYDVFVDPNGPVWSNYGSWIPTDAGSIMQGFGGY